MPKAANDFVQGFDQHGEDRFVFAQDAQIYAGTDAAIKCTVVNMSRDGCRIAVRSKLNPGSRVVMEATGWPLLVATTVWCHDGIAGLVFSSPLKTSDLATILKTAEGLDRLGDEIII